MALVEYKGDVEQTPKAGLVEYTGEVEQRRPEDVGVIEGAGAAIKRGIGSYGDVGSGLGLAGLSVTGQKEAAAKKMQEIKAESKKPQETPAMAWDDFERIASEKGVGAALKEAPKYIVEQVLGNAPQMAGPLAVGAGVGAVSGPLAPITAPLAGIAAYGIQQFGNFLVRQAQEKNDPEELEVAKAAMTAAGTAPLGYFVDRFTAGLGGKSAASIGKEAVTELAKRSGTGIAAGVAKAGAKGAGKGVIAEAPTEVLEQVAERYQAGLDLTGSDAMKEYKEAFAGAAAAGGGIGGTSAAVQTGRQVAKEGKLTPYEGEVSAEPVEKPMTKGERKDMEQAEDRARAAAPVEPTPVTGKEPWEEILGPTPPVETPPVEAAPLEKPPLAPIIPIEKSKKGSKIEGVEEIDINPSELKLSKDVPQFKEDADEAGIVEPLQGEKYDYVGTPPIQVWRRMDGSLEIISGRHRWDLAKRTGAEYIPAQVFDEAKGFNADMAAIMDAELNIRDGKGKVTDYVNYFTEAGNRFGLTKDDYKNRGLLDSEKGRKAYAVSVQGSDELIQALRGRQVKEDTAYRIADAVPNDPRLQALGLKLVNEKPLEQAINILHAAKTIEPKPQDMGGDLFGFDDSGMKLAEDMGKLALEKQKALSADINTIERAGKQPAIARKYGIDVKDPEAIKAKVKEMKEQRAAWDNWASDPVLVDQIRRELAGEVVEPVAVEAKPETAPIEVGQTVTFKYKNDEGKTVEATGTVEERRGMKIIRWQDGTGTSENGKQYPIMKMVLLENASDVKSVAVEAKPEKASVKKPAKKVAVKAEEKPEEESIEEQYNKAFKEMADIKDKLVEARKAGKNVSELERQDEEVTRKALEIAAKYDAERKAQKERAAAGEDLDNLSASELATLMSKHRDKKPRPIAKMFGSNPTEEQQAKHKALMSEWNKVSRKLSAAHKIALDRDNKAFAAKKAAEALPSFELAPEKKQTPAERRAAAEREDKEIADREVEFFKLTPRTPEQGAGNYLQQDMIGAMGLTESEFKKGIDKKSTEPGEPLILRDVTGIESDNYNDDANANVDNEIISQHNEMEGAKSEKVTDDVVDTLSRQAKAVEEYVSLSSQGKVTADEFMASVKAAAAKGEIAPDVYKAIQQIYKKYPAVLEGIRFETITGAERKGKYATAGHYQPLARIIRLFKDTSGVSNPATVRHEIAHTMEQMMTPEQKRMVIRAWRDALIKAARAETEDAGHVFFQNVTKFLHDPSKSTYRAVIKSMPNVSYYQYVNPSEYWAVNAEQILKSRLEGASGLKATMEKLHEGLKQSFGMSNFWVGNRVFDQILTGDRFSNKMLVNYLNQTKMRNYLGEKAPLATWDSMGSSWLEDKKYEYVDKYIDLLRAKQDIERMVDNVSDDVDAYTKETLSHSRISTKIKDFMRDYVAHLADVMRKNNISQQQLHEYLWARHAPERNRVVGQRNPEMGDMAAGISTKDAEDYIRALGEKRIAQLDEAAAWIDKMSQETRTMLVESGYETPETVNAWEGMYKFYAPLYRKDLEYSGGKAGIGRGFSVQGKFSKAAMGSTKEVSDISESIIKDHIRAIEKAERARVTRALFGMAVKHPNPSFWLPIDPKAQKNPEETVNKLKAIGLDEELIKNLMQPPKQGSINPETGLVEYRLSNTILQSDNVVATRIDGNDVYVVFNNSDPRAARLSSAMKNMDLPDVEGLYRASAYITRWFAMVNTQLNPLFGLWNFARDVQGAALNLSTTELKGMEKELLNPKELAKSIRSIYSAIREERKTGERAKGSEDWYEFQEQGGVTGYKAQLVKPQQEVKVLQDAVDELNKGRPKKMVGAVMNWISDYNDTLENAVRLRAYNLALEKGMTKQQAANVGKNLTVNFNRKGAKSQMAGSLYAFFNASVQGTSRLYQTLKGPNGKKIMIGGVLLGVAQAALLAAAGFDEEDPPEFIKEKNIIVPLAMFGIEGKKYLSIPMPLGFNVFPGLGRIMTEATMSKDPSKKFFDMLGLIGNSFNPLGSSGFSWQTIMPTPLDPFAALAQNKDAFGRPIYKEDRATNPQVGYERTRETTWEGWKMMAKFINYATLGTEDTKGGWSPTGDEIAFLAAQAGGGLAREIGKVYGTASDFITGDETPTYKIPLLGKLYGDAESQASQRNRFYANVTKLAEVERTIKGKMERKENVMEYRREHPESQLVNMANRIENEISQLNKRRSEMLKRGATVEQIKRLEDIKAKKMKLLNDRYEQLR